MSKKILRRTLFAIPALLLVYLAIAAFWAHLSVDELLAGYPAPISAALSQRQQDILLKIEDPTFFTHSGLSLADGQGVTTITSAIARDVLLEGGELGGIKGAFQNLYRGVFACCKKVDFGRDVMALVLNRHLDKQRQLDLYVSRVYMGTADGVQVKGLDLASSIYFKKPLTELAEADFIGLVAMIKAPNKFHPLRQPGSYQVRRALAAKMISGLCQPKGWFDTTYDNCDVAID